ncbi:hypothetical protein EV207_14017 [Scopulibacillus darangshiensis]|uniref:Uncharacterized protein n=1 Tax=Scopulibacillus darangshiensis TaxID=442528 RepID=A0A4R2NK49_9BACL|nr:hypothetical protein EV207_14017 [Scopulibacillus darangshiensis]
MSVILFCFSLIVCILFLNGIDLFPDEVVIPLIIGGSIIGLILSLFGRKDAFGKIGIVSNSFFLLFIIIVPIIVRTFIWNQP